jgi:peptidoglycan/xylan/chitin deacetylase (PgdA/CDA1 family)
MRFYYIPSLIRALYPKRIWSIPTSSRDIYLSFDDGPTPDITPWILEMLSQYNAKATFFCVGDNVVKHKKQYQSLLDAGHAVGNHTFNHMKGWQQPLHTYIENVELCKLEVESNLFRPPYGKIKSVQAKELLKSGYRIIMWSILTYDFDKTLNCEGAWKQIIKHTQPGSILVFHDHAKAFENLKVLLPKTLDYFSKQGYSFKAIQL